MIATPTARRTEPPDGTGPSPGRRSRHPAAHRGRPARGLLWPALWACCILWTACQPSSRESQSEQEPPQSASTGRTGQAAGADSRTARPEQPDAFTGQRERMVAQQLRARDITDPRVLAAMARVPRHEFVPPGIRELAYADGPLPIGHEQTISQPYIVALMTQLARPDSSMRALDVGTGSGYQAAVLAELVDHVYGIEIICDLADQARARLERLGYDNITVRCGDGYRGWPEHAPFDIVILAAAPDHVPQPLIDQLAPGGRLVLPVGETWQELVVVEKDEHGKVERHDVIPVRFVPMTGEAQGR